MPTVYINVNINALFPIESLKDNLKEAIKTTKKNGYAVIIQNNRPSYAIIKFPSPGGSNDKLLCDEDDGCDSNDATNNCGESFHDLSNKSHNDYKYIIENDITKPLSAYLAKLQKENPAKLCKKGNWWDVDE